MRKYWRATVIIGVLLTLLIGWAVWRVASGGTDGKDPLKQSNTFAYIDNGGLYWFELADKSGKVEGTFYERKIIEKPGDIPIIEDNTFPLSGTATEQGYEFQVNVGGEMAAYQATFSGPDLLVQKQGESEEYFYQAVTDQELDEYEKAIQEELDLAIYHSEKKENDRIRNFFDELNSLYGHLYAAEDGSLLLFLKIDEALYEGEIMGSLLVAENTGESNEKEYEVNGISDGLILRLYITDAGESIKMEGDFHDSAKSFDLTYWKTGEKLTFQAVTEEEFKQRYEEFKKNAQN